MKKLVASAFLFVLMFAFASHAFASTDPDPVPQPSVPTILSPDIVGPIDPFPPPIVFEDLEDSF